MTPELLWALARGAAITLATGCLTALGVYQQVGRWTPALVAGGIAVCSNVLIQLGVDGAIARVQSLRPRPPASG